MTYHCEIKDEPGRPTLFIRTRTPVSELPQVLGRCFGAIVDYLGAMDQAPAGPPYSAYFNMDMDDLDVEIGFPVAQPVAGKGEIQAGAFPAGKIATCLYTGPYSDMQPAYGALAQFITDSGHAPTGVAYEIYLSDPDEVPPEELQTQIAFPLKP